MQIVSDHIVRDLASVNTRIEKEIRAVSDSIESDLALFYEGRSRRAQAILTVAGVYDIKRLQPVAVSLELLELGIRKHFGETAGGYGSAGVNLALVTADLFYARALQLIVALGEDRLVRELCLALAEVSEGYAYPDADGSPARRDGFTGAAKRLGYMMSRDKEETDVRIGERS